MTLRAILAVVVLFHVPMLTTGCDVGLELTWTAQEHWFEAGQVKSFLLPLNHSQLCFFEPFIPNSPCKKASRFLDCKPNCTQHKREHAVLEVTSTTSLVNFKMLPPSGTLDDAFVIRVQNQTVVYIAEGGPCSSNVSSFEMPMILLQLPSSKPPPTESSALSVGETSSTISAVLIAVLLLVLAVS